MTKGFNQVAGVGFNETRSPTPVSAPVKIIGDIANENELPIYHLDVSQAVGQAPMKEEFFIRFLSGCGKLYGKIVNLFKGQYGLKQPERERYLLLVKWMLGRSSARRNRASFID